MMWRSDMCPSACTRGARVLGALLLTFVAGGCAHIREASEEVRSAGTVGVSQQQTKTGALPFENAFPHRWNERNDGTTYEPCAAVSHETLVDLGLDPSTVNDSAGTDGQSLRGCRWKSTALGRADWTVSQFVGNSVSLAANQARYSSEVDSWLPDVQIGGRTVGVHYTSSGQDCDTYVQSGRAGVITLVMFHVVPPPPPSEICDRALAFTRATTSKMPL